MEVLHFDFKNLSPISAGFCKLENGKFKCYGKSWSLRVSSHPDDTDLANYYFIN